MSRKIIRKVWDKGTPYIQVGGWLILFVTAATSSVSLIDKATAFDGRLTLVEQALIQIQVLDKKLDLVINLMKNK